MPIVSELSPPLMFVIAAGVASTVVLVAAVIDLKKMGKTLRLLNPPAPFHL